MAVRCKLCGATPATAVFYRSVPSRCAECHKAKVRERRADRIEEVRAYDRARANLPHRVAARAEYAAQMPAAQRRRYALADIARAPERRAARVKLLNAVRDGRVQRPAECEACKAATRLHGHHDDYSKPLEVRWLCEPCHVAVHAAMREAVRRSSLQA